MGLGLAAAVTADAILGEDRAKVLRERVGDLLLTGVFVFRPRSLRPKTTGQETENRNMPTDPHRGFLVELKIKQAGRINLSSFKVGIVNNNRSQQAWQPHGIDNSAFQR